MADGIVWDLASKALESLGKSAVQKAASWWGARDDLNKLENTIKMIQARVFDAEQRQEIDSSKAIGEWLRRLKQVLYRADDLFDEVLTLDLQKQQMESSTVAKVGILFSKSGPLYYNRRLAKEIMSIRKQLDAIKSDMDPWDLSVLVPDELQHPITRLMKQRETASFVNTEDVIGREDDQNMIVSMLFDPKYDREKITVIPIVGFGGLGKTTLAQLVFNNERVKKHFDLTGWAYVPEKDNNIAIMGKILKSFTGRNYDNPSLEQIQQDIIKSLETNKYLLVLDDLWEERVDRLIDLVNVLKCGKPGSKVIVTTRSDIVAKVVGTIEAPHKLGTLTDDESWRLFKKLAFRLGQEEKNPTLITIGEEIVKMCGNVPLAIKVVGGSLRSMDTEKDWLQVRDVQCSKARLTKGEDIMGVLKLSYDYLPPALKQCFAYCSMFPKGSWFEKDELAQMWMAQGYFEPSNEDIGDQYFSRLLAQNFFQNPKISDEGHVKRCNMHDLLHDLAKEVAGDDIMLLDDESAVQIHDGLVHINLDCSKCPPLLNAARNLQSLLGINYHANDNKIFSKIQSLRVLSLRYVKVNELPNSIGKLIHLRYLDLDCERIEYLPGSITRLVNLQTLKLQLCWKLKELPRDFAKLVNLRHLLLPDSLTDLPVGFGKLTCLQQLNRFIVGKGYGIDSLGAWNLRGKLDIKFLRWRRCVIEEVKRTNLKNNHQLTSLRLKLDFLEEESTPAADEMNEMLRCLQLPPYLKKLRVLGYKGDEMPLRWLDGLSQLVSIKISQCIECKVVPKLSGLPHLKSVELDSLGELEYVENEDEDNIRIGTASATHNNRCFFPSLKSLVLKKCYKLKGWRRASKDEGERRQLVFPCLLEMEVEECPMLMSMPLAPKLESLAVSKINWKMVESSNVRANDDNEEEAAASSSSTPPPPSSSSSTLSTSLKDLRISDVNDGLITLSISSSMCNLSVLKIRQCSELRNLRFESPNSIRELEIIECRRLKDISEWLQHLCGLEDLQIRVCEELVLEEEEQQQREEEEEEGKSSSGGWQGLRSLRLLTLDKIPKMKTLPRGILCITTLEELRVIDMENLTEIPEEIGNLSLLHLLWIERCPKVKSLPPSILGLPMLEMLFIWKMDNLAELPAGNLPLLHHLEIVDCPKMTSLPTLIQGLTSLQSLWIRACPDLGKKIMTGGQDWHLIQHIPNLAISDGSKRYRRRDGKEDC